MNFGPSKTPAAVTPRSEDRAKAKHCGVFYEVELGDPHSADRDLFPACSEHTLRTLSTPGIPKLEDSENLSVSSFSQNKMPGTFLPSAPRLIFLDLDNTLIPTAWMMEQWKLSGCDTGRKIRSINRHLVNAGFFEVLDEFFHALVQTAPQYQRVVIVTNALASTVHGFYLTDCLPQLRRLLEKYQIPIRSTDCWLPLCGPVPLPHQTGALRELYTTIKLRQFEQELRSFETFLRSVNRKTFYGKKTTLFVPPAPLFTSIDVISVGDQLCEITAAIRLGALNPCLIRHIKLLLSLNFSRDRGATMSPDIFIRRLKDIHSTLMYVLGLPTRTVVSRPLSHSVVSHTVDSELQPLVKPSAVSYKTGKDVPSHTNWINLDAPVVEVTVTPSKPNALTPAFQCTEPRRGQTSFDTAVWVLKSANLAFCVARPQDFDAHDCCPRIRVTFNDSVYLKNVYSNKSLIKATKPLLGAHSSQRAPESTFLEKQRVNAIKNGNTVEQSSQTRLSEEESTKEALKQKHKDVVCVTSLLPDSYTFLREYKHLLFDRHRRQYANKRRDYIQQWIKVSSVLQSIGACSSLNNNRAERPHFNLALPLTAQTEL